MRQDTESTAAATLSGRDLALQRRQVMAQYGKAGLTRRGSSRQPAVARKTFVAAPAVLPVECVAPISDAANIKPVVDAVNGRSISRARRNAMSQKGKSAIKPASAHANGRRRPSRHQSLAQEVSVAAELGGLTKSCGCQACNCGGVSPDATKMSDVVVSSTWTDAKSVKDMSGRALAQVRRAAMAQEGKTGLKRVAQVAKISAAIVSTVNVKPTDSVSGRMLARARRAAMAQEGKAGLKRIAQATKITAGIPEKSRQTAAAKGATGRQLAMHRRLVRSTEGLASVGHKGSQSSGRTRSSTTDQSVPPKVEEGHTLTGHVVTGTMVERSQRTTGNEPGSCRAVTGTEYIGFEQFNEICQTQPQAGPAKVGVSTTLRDHKVSGTEVGRSLKVTGDEHGACRNVTGTEYLSAERFDEFCASRPSPAPAKIGAVQTEKGKTVTGTQVERSAKTTGGESGADRAVTGSSYSKLATDTAPDKVATTHTFQGKTVTGTAVGHTDKITGDEPGNCHAVTGIQYLAAEQYSNVCKTEPPATPLKVSVMSSRGNQEISGSEVGRSSKVTGDESGSCRAITGSQYFTASDFGDLCSTNEARKMGFIQNKVDNRSPKENGDVRGESLPVTGSNYIGVGQRVDNASDTASPISHVAVDQTWNGQTITGSYVGRANLVTGNEFGSCSPISGTPYIGRGQYSSFCKPSDTIAQETVKRDSAVIPATLVTGDRPGAGGSVITGDERGACEPVTGTPYVGADNVSSHCLTDSNRFVTRDRVRAAPPKPPAPADFSIKSPARQAWERRADMGEITGTAYNSERITGPGNKAGGLITGTPEFRHLDNKSFVIEQEEKIAAANQLSGDGSQDGTRVTGDAWHAESRVTGTEGASSLVRNMSQRGESRGFGANAQQFREIERPFIPESRVTGSAGSAAKGAVVTGSGGARA
jgi:hypothetical protein